MFWVLDDLPLVLRPKEKETGTWSWTAQNLLCTFHSMAERGQICPPYPLADDWFSNNRKSNTPPAINCPTVYPYNRLSVHILKFKYRYISESVLISMIPKYLKNSNLCKENNKLVYELLNLISYNLVCKMHSFVTTLNIMIKI